MIAAALFAVVLAAAAPAPETAELDADVEAAKTYFEAGRRAYEAGQFSIAATAFEEAYRLSPRAQVIFSLAQAQRQQYIVDRDPARLRRALVLFKEYIELVPSGGRRDHAVQHVVDLEEHLLRLPQPPPVQKDIEPPKVESKTQLMITSRTPSALAAIGGEEASELPQIREVKPGHHRVRVEAEGFLAEQLEAVAVEGRLVVVDVSLKEKPAVIRVRAPDGADVSLDGRLLGEAPLTAPVEVPAGRHFIAVTRRGSYGFARDLTLDRGQDLALHAELETTTQRNVAYAFLGTATALMVAGAITGGVALAAENTAKDIDGRRLDRAGLSPADLEEYRASVDRRDRYAPPALALLGVGATAAITGALLYFIDAPRIDAR